MINIYSAYSHCSKCRYQCKPAIIIHSFSLVRHFTINLDDSLILTFGLHTKTIWLGLGEDHIMG